MSYITELAVEHNIIFTSKIRYNFLPFRKKLIFNAYNIVQYYKISNFN